MNLWKILAESHGLNEKWLQKRTQNYWEEFKGSTQSKYGRWQKYLQETAVSEPDCSLFECEMAYAGHAGCLPELQADKAVTLVILVGESFEPLLQSVWAHNPARLVPVVNKQYPGDFSGSDQWNAICAPLEMLLKRRPRHTEWQLTIPTVEFDAPKEKENWFAPIVDEPTAVFEFLQKHLKRDLENSTRRVVVDITGAKKTMVAGAFMLAAYSDTEICYIDSKEHHNGRPYGYACEFREVDNPLKKLALQSWHNIEKLYTKGDYAHALAILNTISQEDFPEIQHLATYLRICAHWDEGDIAEAGKLLPNLPEILRSHVPFAVIELKDLFPKTDDASLKIGLFSQTRKIVIYAQDEIERVKRLIRKDASRAAFSRAYALYEALFNFRVTMLFTEHALVVKPGKDLGGESGFSCDEKISWHKEAHIACTNMMSSKAINLLLGEKGPQPISWFSIETNSKNGEISKVRYNATIKWNNPKQYGLSYISQKLTPDEDLKDKRNLITHSYFPAKTEYAEEALRQAEQSFAEYKEQWVDFPKEVDITSLDDPEFYSVLPWESIRDKFGLQFIPVEKV